MLFRSDPAFLADAREDLNDAVERRMGITLPVAMRLEMVGDTAEVWIEPASVAAGPTDVPDELTDADLDLVAGGSMRICKAPGGCEHPEE